MTPTLTPAQLATLKTDIAADSALNALLKTADSSVQIRTAYNLAATPDHWVWRTSVSKSEFVNSVSVDATTFTWVGNGFITRSVGEQAAWQELFSVMNSVNPSLLNVRQAFADILSGTGNAALNRTHMLAISRKKASRAEKLFATGTGSTAVPALMGAEGLLTFEEVELAMALP